MPRGAEHETVLVLDGAAGRSNAPSVKMVVPRTPLGVPPEIPTIQIPPPTPPPTPEIQQPAQREGARDGDLLGAVGRELACRAGSYENLSEAQRARCLRAPWRGVELLQWRHRAEPRGRRSFEPFRAATARSTGSAAPMPAACRPNAPILVLGDVERAVPEPDLRQGN